MYFTVITLYFLCFYNLLRFNTFYFLCLHSSLRLYTLYVLSNYKPFTWALNAFFVMILCCTLYSRFIFFLLCYVASCLLLLCYALVGFRRQYANYANSIPVGRLEGFRGLMPMLNDTISLHQHNGFAPQFRH